MKLYDIYVTDGLIIPMKKANLPKGRGAKLEGLKVFYLPNTYGSQLPKVKIIWAFCHLKFWRCATGHLVQLLFLIYGSFIPRKSSYYIKAFKESMIKRATREFAITAASADQNIGYTPWLCPIRVNISGSPVATYRLAMRNMYFRKCKTQGGGCLWK